jgi:SAM-dependent methyltransferase
VQNDSCDGVYSSHVLEHLALEDFRTALKNTAKILRPGGIFRAVVPDLEWLARCYVAEVAQGNPEANMNFMRANRLGRERRPRRAVDLLRALFGTERHLWMWEAHSLIHEFFNAGFRSVRRCDFNDSEDRMFEHVEDKDRFQNCIAVEATR